MSPGYPFNIRSKGQWIKSHGNKAQKRILGCLFCCFKTMHIRECVYTFTFNFNSQPQEQESLRVVSSQILPECRSLFILLFLVFFRHNSTKLSLVSVLLLNSTWRWSFVYMCRQKVLRAARPDAKKVLFLITDGYSNSGDPRPVARRLRQSSVDIFTFGIRDGNFVELCDMASDDKHEHVYILNSFEEFEALARRALHEGKCYI